MPDQDPADQHWLALACDLAALCPPSQTAFSVGAVIVGADGRELARGHSRDTDLYNHAEESALTRATEDLTTATLYTSLEPCARRKSRAKSCAALILAAAIPRVVFAWREPTLFVEGGGVHVLQNAGVTTVEIPGLSARARLPNAHLLGT